MSTEREDRERYTTDGYFAAAPLYPRPAGIVVTDPPCVDPMQQIYELPSEPFEVRVGGIPWDKVPWVAPAQGQWTWVAGKLQLGSRRLGGVLECFYGDTKE